MSGYQELQVLGAKKVFKPNEGYVFRVSRTPRGRYFLCDKNGYHQQEERNYIDRLQCPMLFSQLSQLELSDRDLSMLGGRVFIGINGVFR